MNQRVSVRAIIRRDQKTLLLRRGSGRESILGKYELPGGRLEYGEQPEDALKRLVDSDTGISVQSMRLFDVITYIDHDYKDTQYVFVLYLITLEGSMEHIKLTTKYDQFLWSKTPYLHRIDVTDSTNIILGLSPQKSIDILTGESLDRQSSIKHRDSIIIYADGGSRGNPGPSASGFILMAEDGQIIEEGGEYLGITTNNQAEYQAVRLSLEHALKLGARVIELRLDSLLVVNQMKGIYNIRNRELWPIHERIKILIEKFEKVIFTHVKREFNQLADGMVNKVLDASSSRN